MHLNHPSIVLWDGVAIVRQRIITPNAIGTLPMSRPILNLIPKPMIRTWKRHRSFVSTALKEGKTMIWEKTLERLRRQGWGFACAKCIDLETQEEFYLVSVYRGHEGLTKLFSTLEEAAITLNRSLVLITT